MDNMTLFDHLPPCPTCGGTGRLDRPTVTERPDDPDTSAAAGAATRRREGSTVTQVRPNTQRHRLLAAYRSNPDGLNDREAAVVADLDHPGVCWWKRSSELRQAGYVKVIDHRRDAVTNMDRDICTITWAGHMALQRADDEAKLIAAGVS